MTGTPHRGRGLPLWAHLSVLALVPLVGLGVLVSTTAVRAATDTEVATDVEGEVRAVALRAEAAVAVAAETSALVQVLVAEVPAVHAALGPDAGPVPGRRSAAEVARRAARVTDDALAAAAGAPSARSDVAVVRAAVLAARTAVASGEVPATAVEPLVRGLLSAARSLGRVSDARTVDRYDGVSAATVLHGRDVEATAATAVVWSQQLPTWTATIVDRGAGAGGGQSAWISNRQETTIAESRMDGLADPDLAAAWRTVRADQAIHDLRRTLDVDAVPGRAPAVLAEVVAQGAARDARVAALLDRAATEALESATADQAAAREQQLESIGLGLVVVALAGVLVWWVSRRLRRAMRSVTRSAEQLNEGTLVEVPAEGPREVRTVALVLRDAGLGLQRIQEQVAAFAHGDLDGSTVRTAGPGALGETVHASVQRMVVAARQNERMRLELAHQAAHDALTGLANRVQALRLVSAALARAHRSETAVGLLFVDLDGFKAVNDRHGHAAGDDLLRAVARRMVASVRETDTVCRLGGDEFLVVLDDMVAEVDLLTVADRIVRSVAEEVVVRAGLHDVVVHVGASVGGVLSRGCVTAQDLIAQADAATYEAKHQGRGRVELYDDGLRARTTGRAELEAALRTALADDELHLVYQPLVDVATRRVTGFEALVRWDRPGHGPVYPDQFVPVAELSDLVVELDRWVLRAALTQLAAWQADGGVAGLRMAVNLSGRDLADPGTVAHVAQVLADTGVPPSSVVLEVTETVFSGTEVALTTLAGLRALGVGVAIDDFGTGFTSIGQLATLPADKLKIDRSFVVVDDTVRRSLLRLMIQTAHALGLQVVAEGVETEEHWQLLQDEECDLAQGYLLSRPVLAGPAGGMARTGLLPAPVAVPS